MSKSKFNHIKIFQKMRINNRRDFIKSTLISTTGVFLTPGLIAKTNSKSTQFEISLAEWSFHRVLRANEMSNLDFPVVARKLGISGVEYVNTFFMDKAKDTKYLAELKNICKNEGVTSVLIMCDREGFIGHPDKEERLKTVDNHKKWIDAAQFMGCHSIRINAKSQGSFKEQQKLVADGTRLLCEYGQKAEINVLIENHGGYSSSGKWLSRVIGMIDHERAGTLPDFGNFIVNRDTGEEYDRYKGITELMPFAKGVSAKSINFDKEGNESFTDYLKMMTIVKKSGYSGYIGIEYAGNQLPERDGVVATKRLLEKTFKAVV